MLVVDVDQSVFGDDYDIAVTTEDLRELYNTGALGNFASELYICSLNNEMMGWDIKFGFFNPSIMTPTINRDERLMTFVARLSMPDRDRNFCYFLSYVDHVKWHWMLCVIFPKQHVAHWLDPNIGDKGINVDAKNLVDTGLYRYYQGCILRNTQSVHWKIVKCPQQPSCHLCSYYVMNFIRDIIQFVRANNGAEIDDLSQCFPNGGETYEDSKIDEVREMSAAYLYDYISDRYPVVLGHES